ncbi:MAG: 3-dehydroquinate synthase, partial [Bryobacteraceae bacterium]
MPTYEVKTAHERYEAIVERGITGRAAAFLPANAGKVFVVSTADVWRHQASRLEQGMRNTPFELLLLPGGEERKRLAPVEAMAEEMVARGGDRSSMVVAFGGGIVNDMAGFLAATFMRGIAVLQVPTTLLGQVDAAIGGKTGVNLAAGKNLMGAFHQPIAVLVDPALLDTLPEREYRAGLYEVIKYGIIASPSLFERIGTSLPSLFAREPAALSA